RTHRRERRVAVPGVLRRQSRVEHRRAVRNDGATPARAPEVTFYPANAGSSGFAATTPPRLEGANERGSRRSRAIAGPVPIDFHQGQANNQRVVDHHHPQDWISGFAGWSINEHEGRKHKSYGRLRG